jgi:nicotinamidase-related amidase
VYGVALEVCDRYAVDGMLARGGGFEVVLVEDAVAALDPAEGAALVDEWRKRGVRLATTDQMVAEL